MPPKLEARYRQIHMDFHTHGDIPSVGSAFDPEEFATTLACAHVNSVTCFARCHHGWMYYDSKLFPERVHPNLANKDLLKQQIEACHERGIRVPVYTTVQWDLLTADERPEWLVISPDGAWTGTKPYEAGFYRNLCVNTAYREFLKAHTREFCEALPLDGVFFDIVWAQDCSCRVCRAAIEAQGRDPTHAETRMEYARALMQDFVEEMSELVWSLHPEASIYYNGSGTDLHFRDHLAALSHIEFDALPSGRPDGYMNFPVMARYSRNTGLDCVGQTGKFHRSWGDFHSYKNSAALDYDCFQLLAQGCKVMIGDQLPPSGTIDAEVYKLVGSVYAQVELKEPWCVGARPVVDIAVLHPDEFGSSRETRHGVVRMLEECGQQFDIIDSQMDFRPYKVLVLPDCVSVSPSLARSLSAYVAGGGKLLASFESGMNAERTEFLLPELGVRCLGPGPLADDGKPARGRKFAHADFADYILPQGDVGNGLPSVEHVMYTRGVDVEPVGGAEVLSPVVQSYFDRSYRQFCSHLQTPSSGKAGSAGIVRNGNCIYFAHKVFELYGQCGMLWVKKLVRNALGLLLPKPVLRHDGPSTLQTTVTDQPEQNRWVVHLLHYPPLRRATELEIIEDVLPVYEVKVSLRAPKPVKRVIERPQVFYDLEFWEKDGRVEFVVPKVLGHAMIELEFER